MKVIGLTGGAGSGKSAVAGMLKAKGILYLNADRYAREVVELGQPALREIAEAFGPRMLQPDGNLDRSRMANLIFSDLEAKKRLESIIHPRVINRIGEEIARARSEGVYPAVVVEVPLLFESGCEAMMDEVWVVDASEDKQIARMMERDGLTEDMAKKRLRAQIDPQKRIEKADIVIENNGSIEDLARTVDAVWAAAQARWLHGEA